MSPIIKKLDEIKNANALTLLFLIMLDIIDKTIKLMNRNTQTVTIIINIIIMHCTIKLYNSKQLYPYRYNNLTYLIYDGNFFDNKECDLK